jgi:hypothetical protein
MWIILSPWYWRSRLFPVIVVPFNTNRYYLCYTVLFACGCCTFFSLILSPSSYPSFGSRIPTTHSPTYTHTHTYKSLRIALTFLLLSPLQTSFFFSIHYYTNILAFCTFFSLAFSPLSPSRPFVSTRLYLSASTICLLTLSAQALLVLNKQTNKQVFPSR